MGKPVVGPERNNYSIRLRCPHLTLLLALACSSCASGPDSSGETGPKSVLVGQLLAIFPGLFVHGLGHSYAGNEEKAKELMTMELYSLLTAGLGGAVLALGESEDQDAVKVAGWIGIGVGAVPFLGTWIYDIVYTPSEIRRYNQQLKRLE